MPGSTPPTSQLDWLISTTAMIVLSWSRATRDLLKSFGWGIRALHQLDAATMVPFPRRLPHTISPLEGDGFEPSAPARKRRFLLRKANCGTERGQPKRVVSYAVPRVRIHLPPAESLSLSRIHFRGSRTPAFRAGVRSCLGDWLRRDAQGVSRSRQPP